MVAWQSYRLTDDYANTRRWALEDAHVDGSLWAAFIEGWRQALSSTPSDTGLREALGGYASLDDLLTNLDGYSRMFKEDSAIWREFKICAAVIRALVNLSAKDNGNG
jgi:phosphate-selective porin